MKPALLEALPRLWVEPIEHLAARLEHRKHPFGHRDRPTIARISSGTCAAPLGREYAEAAQFNPVSLRQRICDRVEDRVDDVLHVLPIQVGVLLGELLNQFGLEHRKPWAKQLNGQLWSVIRRLLSVPSSRGG